MSVLLGLVCLLGGIFGVFFSAFRMKQAKDEQWRNDWEADIGSGGSFTKSISTSMRTFFWGTMIAISCFVILIGVGLVGGNSDTDKSTKASEPEATASQAATAESSASSQIESPPAQASASDAVTAPQTTTDASNSDSNKQEQQKDEAAGK